MPEHSSSDARSTHLIELNRKQRCLARTHGMNRFVARMSEIVNSAQLVRDKSRLNIVVAITNLPSDSTKGWSHTGHMEE